MEVVSRKDLVKPLSWMTATTLTKGYGSTWQGTPSAELPGIASTYHNFGLQRQRFGTGSLRTGSGRGDGTAIVVMLLAALGDGVQRSPNKQS